jgi:alpha-tubulin suppressor-like RCC1 family protein
MLAMLASPAQGRAKRLALSLPASARVDARVVASGTVQARGRHLHVLLQRRAGGRWRTFATARVSHGRFRVAFRAPSSPVTLIVRAVLHRRHVRPMVSRARRLSILARPPAPPPAPFSVGVVDWGDNMLGQLGGGFKGTKSPLAVTVLGLGNVKQVAATYFTSYALLADGTVTAWGGNDSGQLGDGLAGPASSAPVHVLGLSGVTAIAAGGAHAMALLGNGTVATWGGNLNGQLGDGTTLAGKLGPGRVVPALVPGLGGVVAIAAGGGDDAVLLGDGSVMAWGENKDGQLGDGTKVEKPRPTRVAGLTGVKGLALGGIPSLSGHMLALLGDGTVRAIGANGSGQLGDGTTTDSSSPVAVKGLSGVVQVAASASHSLALLHDGTVLAWGNNEFGELGAAPSGPEKCGTAPCSKVPFTVGIHGVSAIAAGWRFSLALQGGAVFSWGWNELGQLGDGTTANSSTPVGVVGLGPVSQISAGEKHSIALLQSPGPAPVIEVVPGPGSLAVRWRAGESGEKWGVSWRPVEHPPAAWSNHVTLAPQTRSYTITGLSARPYEVRVRNQSFGIKIATGTPAG